MSARLYADALPPGDARYRTLVEATSAIVWSCPASGLHVEPQPLWMAFTGQTAEQMLGSGWVEAVHPDDAGRAAMRWTQAVASGEPFLSEHRIRRHDGAWRWMRVHAVPIRGPGNDIAEWFGVMVDISEGKQAEEALRASEARYRTLHEGMRDAFVQVDMQGRIVECNALYCRMLGYTADELRRMTYVELTPTRWHAPEAAIVRDQILARGYSEVYEKEYRRKDGRVIPVELRTILVRDGQGQPQAMWAMVRDVSERRRMEESLTRERQRFQLALEAAPIAILMTDADGNIMLANPALQRLFGYTSEELLGRKVELLVPLSLRERHGQLRGAASTTPQVRRMGKGSRLTGRRKDGSVFPIDVGLSTIESDSAPSTIAVVADTSSHEAAIARQDQARRVAEAASEAKTTFLANMSHELRTPLNAVLGINEVLRLDGVTPKQAALLDKQQAAGRHLLQVINDILDLARIESGRHELMTRPFRIADLVRTVTDMAHESARAKGLRLSAQVEAGEIPFLGDDTRLRQALLNYVNNAVKFADTGTVSIRVRPLEAAVHDMLVLFEVQDEGDGIEAEVLSRLFTPFEQADASSTRRYGGTGLGLAITRRIAEMMGGSAGAQSVPGHGSTFWFTARIERATPGPAPAVPNEPPAAALRRRHPGRRILLAEDDPVSAEIAQHMLAATGLAITVATNGAEAVDLAAARHFDLILMDLTMPGMDGLEATRRIRERTGGTRTPILALTANAFAEDRARCLAAGMIDLVSKPVDAATLYSAVLRGLEAGPRPADA